MKGLILAAGKGTRLYPLTKDLPKPLVKVNDCPMIEYCINNLVDVGITDIGIVINPIHQELFEMALLKYNHINISYIHQVEQKGIAHAIKASHSYIGNDPFICLLGDNIILNSLYPLKNKLNHNELVLSLQQVEDPTQYGIAELNKGKITNIIEKPINPSSNLAIMGAYGFTHYIFEAIELISPSLRGEYEITDAIKYLIMNKEVYDIHYDYILFGNDFFDAGTPERLKFIENYLKYLYTN